MMLKTGVRGTGGKPLSYFGLWSWRFLKTFTSLVRRGIHEPHVSTSQPVERLSNLSTAGLIYMGFRSHF